VAFVETLTGRIRQLPGVSSAGIISNVPLSGNSGKSAAKIKGYALRPGESPRGHYSYWVGGDYFRTLGITLRQGRFLTSSDSRRAQRVCVVDEDFARYYWPASSALGQQLFLGSEERGDPFTIVGVVGHVQQAGLTDETAQGAIYYPYSFRTSSDDIFLVARTSLLPDSLGTALRQVVRQIDPILPVSSLRSMDTLISDSLVTRRSPALLATLFSAIALLLTAIGSYGVLSYAVSQRHREIGVRMALGARPAQIRGQFFSLALRLLACGTLLGAIGAWLAGRAMQTVLFHVAALDWPTLAAVAAILATVSIVACLLPAQRAARTSPLEALSDQ
jgi:predicted permease